MKSQAKIFFLGPNGSYSSLVVDENISAIYDILNTSEKDVCFEMAESFDQIFHFLETNNTYAMVPVENSITGNVAEVFNRFFSGRYNILGEFYLNIEHCLLAKDTIAVEKVSTIFSHPQGFLQCSEFLSRFNWQKVLANSTSEASKMVKKSLDENCVAIASKQSAEIYDLKILLENIGNQKINKTRFVLIQKAKNFFEFQHVKTFLEMKYTLLVHLAHEKGSLVRFLSVIEKLGGNLTKIESRPIADKLWQYVFFVDFVSQEKINLLMLKKYTQELKLLGMYHTKE